VRNKGEALDMSLATKPVNRVAVERRVATITTRRSVKNVQQAAWLLRSVTMIDLTTLSGDDTPGCVQRLCAKAKNPVREDILEQLGAVELNIKVGAVCVYADRVADAVKALAGTGIPVAAVATGFPAGQILHKHKLEEIRGAVADGAQEIDIVIPRKHVLCGDWQRLYDDVKEFREACGEAHLKAIIATGELPSLSAVYTAGMVCMMAGADFIKTSTGKEKTNASLDVSLVMLRSIRDFYDRTGFKVGFKPAGGIRTAKQALSYLILIKEELGDEWLNNELLRIGASTLLTDVERQLYHCATQHYAADNYMPMP